MFIFKLVVGIIVNLAVFGGLLFLPAGTLAWWRAWVFLGAVITGTVATMVGIFRDNKELLNEQFKPPIQQGQPLADKIVVLLVIATFLGLIVYIPLDVFRFPSMGKPGTVVSSLGLALFIAGWWIISLAFRENAFAAPVVKHQSDCSPCGSWSRNSS